MPYDVIDEKGNVVEVSKEIKATMVYDVFDTSNRQDVMLPWAPDRTIAEYIGDMPTDHKYGFSTSNGIVSPEEIDSTTLDYDDHLIVTVVPLGGKIGTIFGMIAMTIAAVIATPFTAGASWIAWAGAALAWVGAAVTIATGIMSMTQKKPKTDSSASYGIDGPKNTDSEDTVVPFVYGTMRVAGNKVNVFTENVSGKEQKVYLQYVLSEGPVESISDIQVNSQDASVYQSVVSDVRLGSATQNPMQWFSSSDSMYNVSAKLTKAPQTFTTLQEVDRIRLDFAFTNGLYNVSKKGKYGSETVYLDGYYRKQGDTDWISFTRSADWNIIDNENSVTDIAVSGLRITVLMNGSDGQATSSYSTAVQIKPADGKSSGAKSSYLGGYVRSLSNADGNGFYTVGSESGSFSNSTLVNPDGSTQFVASSKLVTFEIGNLRDTQWAFQCSGGTIVQVEGYYATSLNFTNNTTTEWRQSVMSPPLDRGIYEIQIARHNRDASTSSDVVDLLYLEDIGQISNTVINYNNTAYYGVQITLGTDISNEPTVTALVKGRLVNIYDRKGNVTAFQWSDNPADIALDILLLDRSNYGITTSRIDFPAFDDWRQYCSNNGLKFNGIFDTVTNVWDAVADVTRVGRAGIVLKGMQWTIVVEAPADPVMLFSEANIVEGTLSLQWTGRKDRANMQEIQYYDENDGYKQHSAFAIDDSYLHNGDALVKTTTTLIGVTDATQAANEAWLLLNIARYVNQIISFDVPYQALGVAIGDVFLFQHTITDWGYEAKAVSTQSDTVFTIDSPIPVTDASWKMMVVQSLTNLCSAPIVSVSGNDVLCGSMTDAVWTDADNGKPYKTDEVYAWTGATTDVYNTKIKSAKNLRAVINGVEFDILDHTFANGEWFLTLDRDVGVTTGTIQIFSIDRIATASVTLGATDTTANTQSVTITNWDDEIAIINRNSILLFGTDSVKAKPFRCTKITYKDDHTRSVGGVEYNESIYGPNPQPAPNYSGLTLYPSQCSGLSVSTGSSVSQGGSMVYFGDVNWIRPISDTRVYQSATIYVSRNYGDFINEQTVSNPTQTVHITGDVNDVIRVKVVANYADNEQADYTVAPIVSFELRNETSLPTEPDGTSLTATGGIRLISLAWNKVNDDFVASYELYESNTNDIATAYRVFIGDASSFVRNGLDPSETMFYWLRTVSSSGTTSAWTASVSATTRYVLTDDLEESIRNTASIAQQVLSNIGTPIAIQSDTLPDPAGYQNGQFISLFDKDGNGVLYKKVNGVWQKVVADVTVGADGLITTDQIAQIQAANLGGKLTAEQIESVTGEQITDLVVKPDQIQSVPVAKITGQMTADQIQSVSVDTIEGLIKANQIESITGSQITDLVVKPDDITSVPGTKVTGIISTDQLSRAPSNNLIYDGCGQTSNWSANNSAITLSVQKPGTTFGYGIDGSIAATISQNLTDYNWAIVSFAPTGTHGVSVVPGEIVELQFLGSASASGALACAYVDWYDASGNKVNGPQSTSDITLTQSTHANVSTDYAQFYALGQTVPEGAVYATFNIRLTGNAGTTFYLTHALIGVSNSSATQPMQWVNGARPLVDAVNIQGKIVSDQLGEIDAKLISSTLSVKQIEDLEMANISGQISSTQISDNAVTTPAIQAGAVVTASIAAASITGEKLQIGSPSNVIWNPSCTNGTDGWVWDCKYIANDNPIRPYVVTRNPPTSVNAEGGIFGQAFNTNDSGKFFDTEGIFFMWSPNSDNANAVSCVAGNRVFAAAYVQCGNGSVANVGIRFYDASGNRIADAQNVCSNLAATATDNKTVAQFSDLSLYHRIGFVGDVPAGAVSMVMNVWFSGTTAGITQPFGQMCKAQLGYVTSNVTEIPEYTPGGITSISGGVITTNSINAEKIVSRSITADQIAAQSLTANEIAANTITANEIAAQTITANEIAVGGIVAQNIAAGTITGDKISGSTITGNNIAGNTITGNNIVGSTITGDKIAANTITAQNIAANTITAQNIAANTITAQNIAAYAIVAQNIAAGAITAEKLSVSNPSNLIANSVFDTQGAQTAGWSAGIVGSSTGAAISSAANNGFSLGWLYVPSSGSIPDQSGLIATYRDIQVVGNQRFCASVRIGNTGWDGYIQIAFYDKNGNMVGVSYGNHIHNTDWSIASNMGLSYCFATAAASATVARISLCALNNTGSTLSNGPGMAFTNVMFGPVGVNVTTPPDWVSGAGTSIDGGMLITSSLTADKIAAYTITALQIAANTITADKIASRTITADQIAAATITAIEIKANTITALQIAANTITGDQIAANTITANHIQAGAVNAEAIAANAVIAGKIAAGAVTAGTIAANAITAGAISAGAVNTAAIQAGAIIASHISANAITSASIQAGAVTGDQIAAHSIHADNLAVEALIVDHAQIGDLVVGTNHITDNAVTTYVSATWTDIVKSTGGGTSNQKNVGSVTFSEPEGRAGFVQWYFETYVDNDHSYDFTINLNGNTIYTRTGMKGVMDHGVISVPINTQSGSNEMDVIYSSSGTINLQLRSIIIITRAK